MRDAARKPSKDPTDHQLPTRGKDTTPFTVSASALMRSLRERNAPRRAEVLRRVAALRRIVGCQGRSKS